MEQKYITVMVDGNSNHDMIIKDIDGLIKLIDLELGVESEKKNRPVEATYPWKSDTLN